MHPNNKTINIQSEAEIYLETLKKSVNQIDPQAISILKKLKESNYDSFLVGGCVRDILVGIPPKDFDIATNALPNEVKKKVSYCFIIGRRFKLVHARRGEKIFEIATYRREATVEEIESNASTELPYFEENYFGTLQEDSFRRDFTINALFYDPLEQALVDHCNGLQDIKLKIIRVIGEPIERLKEDPIRILRAVRLSHKLDFQIEPNLRKAIYDQAEDLVRTAAPRRREEWLKFFKLPQQENVWMDLYDLNILKFVIPTLHSLFETEEKREIFLSYIRRRSYVGFDLSNNVEIFAAVVYSYLLTEYEHPLKINIREISDLKSFQNFSKDELGIYKAEMQSIELSIQLINALRNKEGYLKKGERRRASLLSNPHFNLSLKLALLSGDFTEQDLLFWTTEKENLLQKN